MSDVTWLPGLSIPMDPDAILDYEFDLTKWLDGDTLASATASAVNCEAVARTAVADNIVVFRVSNATKGASITVRVTTVSGQVDDMTVYFRVSDR